MTAPDVDVVAQGENGIEAVELIEEHHPDPGFSRCADARAGWFRRYSARDGSASQREGKRASWQLPQFVFATAYDRVTCARCAPLDVNAVDYVLKPFDRGRVEKALERVR